MRSCGRPISSARAALSSAETTSASRTTSLASSGCGLLRVLVHQAREQVLVEAAPVDADAHRLAVAAGRLDHLGELRIALAAAADVARVDAVLGERLGAGRVLAQQLVPVEVEVADDRHRHAELRQALDDVRHRRRRLVGVDGDAHQLRARDARARGPAAPCLRRRPCRCWSSTARRPGDRRRPSPGRCGRACSGGGRSGCSWCASRGFLRCAACRLGVDPAVHVGFEHVERNGAAAEHHVVERADVEPVAELRRRLAAQLLDLQLADLVRERLARGCRCSGRSR